MSADLYSTLLRWGPNGTGLAKLHGQRVVLTERPELGVPYFELDYVPQVRMRMLRERACDPRRDMRDEEVAAADAFLRRVFA